jgi:hypothetical protein
MVVSDATFSGLEVEPKFSYRDPSWQRNGEKSLVGAGADLHLLWHAKISDCSRLRDASSLLGSGSHLDEARSQPDQDRGKVYVSTPNKSCAALRSYSIEVTVGMVSSASDIRDPAKQVPGMFAGRGPFVSASEFRGQAGVYHRAQVGSFATIAEGNGSAVALHACPRLAIIFRVTAYAASGDNPTTSSRKPTNLSRSSTIRSGLFFTACPSDRGDPSAPRRLHATAPVRGPRIPVITCSRISGLMSRTRGTAMQRCPLKSCDGYVHLSLATSRRKIAHLQREFRIGSLAGNCKVVRTGA